MSKQRLPPLLLLCHRDNMKTEKILDIQHRTERKTYMVHQYKNNGYNILLDVNSGSAIWFLITRKKDWMRQLLF